MANLFNWVKQKRWLVARGVLVGVLVFLLGIHVVDTSDTLDRSIKIGIGNEKVITLGYIAYAIGSVDYTYDGTNDDVQFQAALNALPATGGRLVDVSAVQKNFSATVARAIPNVTIEGTGAGSYFVNNGVIALFSAGSQSGWVFKDLKTDAGGITVSSATNYLFFNIWIGTTYYASSGLNSATGAVDTIVGPNTATDDVPGATGYWVKDAGTGRIVYTTVVNNASPALQYALNYFGDVDYGVQNVYVQQYYYYNCTESVEIPEGTYLHGQGKDDKGTVIIFTGCDGFKKKTAAASNVRVILEDMCLIADNTHTVIDASLWGVCTFNRIRVRGGLVGIKYNGNYMNTILDSEIALNLTGIRTDSAANSLWIYRTRIEGTAAGGDPGSTQIGIDNNGAFDVSLIDCSFARLGKAIRLGAYSPAFTAERPMFEQIASDGAAIDLGSSGAAKVYIIAPHYDGGTYPHVIGTVGPAFTYQYESVSLPESYQGKYNVVTKSASANLTAFECQGIITVAGAVAPVIFGLPTAVAGLDALIVDQDGAQNITITPFGGDKIGNASTSANHTATAGDSFHIYTVDSTNWDILSSRGTWTLH